MQCQRAKFLEKFNLIDMVMKIKNLKSFATMELEAKQELENNSNLKPDFIAVPVFEKDWNYTHALFGDEKPRSPYCLIFQVKGTGIYPIFNYFQDEIMNNQILEKEYNLFIKSYRNEKNIIRSMVETMIGKVKEMEGIPYDFAPFENQAEINDKTNSFLKEFRLEMIKVENLTVFTTRVAACVKIEFKGGNGVCFIIDEAHWDILEKHIILS
jgi:hypothetical protein